MAKKFRDLVAHMPEERQTRIAAETQRLIDEMPLQELRRALDLTQQQVAASLGINPVAVSKMESQTDRYVSTLRRFVEAMGGELRIVAHRRPPPETPPPLGQMVRLIAGFGGVLGRQHDAHPGPKAIWEGMQKVRAFAIAFEARKVAYAEDG